MRRTIKPLASLAALLAPLMAPAQGTEPRWLVDTLYGSGKINAVIAVVAVILLGLFLWLFRMDRRIKRMEQDLPQRDR